MQLKNEAHKSHVSYIVQLCTNLIVSVVPGSDVKLQDLLHVGAHQHIPRWELVSSLLHHLTLLTKQSLMNLNIIYISLSAPTAQHNVVNIHLS